MPKKVKIVVEDYIQAFVEILTSFVDSYYEIIPKEVEEALNRDILLATAVLHSKMRDTLSSLLYDAYKNNLEGLQLNENYFDVGDIEIERIFELALVLQENWKEISNEAKYLASGNDSIRDSHSSKEYVEKLLEDYKVLEAIKNKDPKLLN